MLPSQFKRLIETLRSNLGSIQKTLEEQERATRDGSSASGQDQREASRIIASAISEASDKDVPTYEKTQRDKEYRQQDRLVWATWLAFGAAAVYAGIAAYQSHLMHKTYGQIQLQTGIAQEALTQNQIQNVATLAQMDVQTAAQVQSARAAENAAKIATESLQISARAYVVPSLKTDDLQQCSVSRNDTSFCARIHFQNIGNTPATALVVYGDMEFGDKGNPPTSGPIPSYDGKIGRSLSRETGDDSEKIIRKRNMGQDQATEATTDGYYLFGYIQYKDIFSTHHVTAFCNFYPTRSHDITEYLPSQCPNGNWLDHPPNQESKTKKTR